MEKTQQFMENNYWVTTTTTYSNIKIKYIITK